MTSTTEVAAVLHDVANVAHVTEPPADPDQALDLVAAAVAADKELLAMCARIAEHHAEVRAQWRQFDPAGRPPPGGGRRFGCLSVLFSPVFWFRTVRRSPATVPSPGLRGGSEAGGRSPDPNPALSAPGTNHGSDG